MATPASPPPATVIPAQLGFLAIYNPSLGTTDETVDDQIVYYASVSTQSQKKRRHRSRDHHSGKPTDDVSQEERNERLRQIGLAQGMVEFGRGFARGQPVDTIESEKSRVVLHELEPGWWILASIDLTKLPLPPRLGAQSSNQQDGHTEHVEYSSREIKPPFLLLRDLLRAHSIFLLHHAPSLSALFVKTRRSKFVGILSRYWDLYLSTWDVMLHGNPADHIFGGVKIAACGELGVGVGEEHRGSGEREVLEGFTGRIEGLVDLIVSKFGPTSPEDVEVAENKDAKEKENPAELEASSAQSWLGTGEEPHGEDGAIFLGVGALSTKSVRDIAYWMEDLCTWGENAYGVKDRVTSTREIKQTRKHSHSHLDVERTRPKPSSGDDNGPSDPTDSTARVSSQSPNEQPSTTAASTDDTADETGMNKFMNYLKMGYGTHWTLGSSTEAEGMRAEPVNVAEHTQINDKTPSIPSLQSHRPSPRRTFSDKVGHYLIGLKGDVEETGSDAENDDGGRVSDGSFHEAEYHSRVLVRTLTVELEQNRRPSTEETQDLGSGDRELRATRSGRKDSADPDSYFDSQDRNKTERLRVVVYVNKPFIFTFLFKKRTDSLAWDTLYRSLHYQLAPLRKPLAVSTTYRPERPDLAGATAASSAPGSHIFDLVWDPKTLKIHSTIPNIPTYAEMALSQQQPEKVTNPIVWSRAEAISTHNQILNTYIATMKDHSKLERTCKTSRGWWVVWTRILEKNDSTLTLRGVQRPGSPDDSTDDTTVPEEPEADIVGSSSGGGDGGGVKKPTISRLLSEESAETQYSRVSRWTTETSPGVLATTTKPNVSKEIFLVRRERSGTEGVVGGGEGGAATRGGGGVGAALGMGLGGWGMDSVAAAAAAGGTNSISGMGGSVGRLAQGIGVDTGKYIEGLLNLGR